MVKVELLQNDIHRAIWDWLMNGNNGIKELYFIKGSYDTDGSAKLDSSVTYTPDTVGNSDVITQFLGGTTWKRYSFMIKQYVPLTSTSNTATNINVLKVFEGVAKWVNEQVQSNNLPKFPLNCEITKVIINAGSVAGVDMDGSEFQQIIQFEYIEKSKKEIY